MDSSNLLTPTSRDIQSPKPGNMPKNLVKSAYDSLDHYTQVQYQLLWEDFIYSLRDGMKLLKKYFQSGEKKLKNDAERFIVYYADVQLKQMAGATLHMVFPNIDINTNKDKNLTSGSLLYLSNDKFNSITTGIIEDIGEGVVIVRLRSIEKIMLHPTAKFDVIENKAYFRAYEPYLNCLKLMTNWNSSPLIDYILGWTCKVKPPNYIQDDTIFEFSAYNSQQVFVRSPVMNISKWFSASDMGLNEGQRKALHLALTNDIAIIQGPPGTGKTFLGVKIVQTLIQNRNLWQHLGPILLVCFTNHGLDQFLEKVIDDIHLKPFQLVRFGSRSESEKLESYNIFHLRKNRKVKSEMNKVHKERRRIEKLQTDAIAVFVTKQAEANRKILDETCLGDFMDSKHYQSLIQQFGETGQAMVLWLGEALLKMMDKAATAKPGATDFALQFDSPERAANNVKKTSGKMAKSDNIVGQMSAAGWQVEGIRTQIKNVFNGALQMDETASVEDLKCVEDVWDLNAVDRWRLYLFWLKQWRQEYTDDLQELNKMYEDNELEIAMERAYRDDLLLNDDTMIIGMTTTGAALNRELLAIVKPGIVIVEEAAEVTESHVVTALTENCSHLIMIGDHKQLKPHTNCHDLAVNNGTEVSFFERMIENGVPYATLTVQHRMRPRIAKLLVPHIYKKLECHPSVFEYKAIKGIESSVFFLDHNFHFKDQKATNSTSFINVQEAEFVIALCRYMLQQNYPASRITILSAYKGQVQLLKELAENNVIFSEVHITSFDDFQGEENDIIILSLVRSNFQSKAGFLTVENRVCVALSRARMGLYAVGNFRMLNKIPVWKPIVQSMKRDNLMGPMLKIFCQNHPNIKFNVRVAKDFNQVPNGGCKRPCEYIYPECGHRCELLCHHVDMEHTRACGLMCSRKCPRGHLCQKPCSEPCGSCETQIGASNLNCTHPYIWKCGEVTVTPVCEFPCERKLQCGHMCTKMCKEVCDKDCGGIVKKKLTKCGHEVMVTCSSGYSDIKCMERCEHVRFCGHKCNKLCHEPCGPCDSSVQALHPKCLHTITVKCQDTMYNEFTNVMCQKQVVITADCGHRNTVPCYQGKRGLKCSARCSATLQCGHRCSGLCQNCSPHDGIQVHEPCNEKCYKPLLCGHYCELTCSEECLKCVNDCGLSCAHRTCVLPCGIACVPCTKPCSWSCPHYSCSKLCHEPCNRPKCNNRCSKLLRCYHPCVGLCGEPCPTSCRICNPEVFRQYPYGSGFVQLTDCGHLVPVDELDSLMKSPVGVAQGSVGFKQCPRCKAYIRNSVRYGNEVKETRKLIAQIRVQLRDSLVKHKVYNNLTTSASSITRPELWLEMKRCLLVIDTLSMSDTDMIILGKITKLVGPLCSKLRHFQVTDALDVLCSWMSAWRLELRQVGLERKSLDELYLRINRVRLMKQLLIICDMKKILQDDALKVYKDIANGSLLPFDKEMMKKVHIAVHQLASKSNMLKQDPENFLEDPCVLFTWNSNGWKKCDAGHCYQQTSTTQSTECLECFANKSPSKKCIVQ